MIALAASCGEDGNYTKAERAQDAGRQFIRASLDSKYEKAKFYLLKDSANLHLFTTWKNTYYDNLTQNEKEEYEDASIIAIKIETQPDSTVDYINTNSYKRNDTVVLNIVKSKDEWLVDLKKVHGWKH